MAGAMRPRFWTLHPTPWHWVSLFTHTPSSASLALHRLVLHHTLLMFVVVRSMYAAMSAVQMMEPRMDIGVNPANSRSVADALAAGVAPPEPTLEETLALCDGLLVRADRVISCTVPRLRLLTCVLPCRLRKLRGTAVIRWQTRC